MSKKATTTASGTRRKPEAQPAANVTAARPKLGRPPIYNDGQQMAEAVNAYMAECEAKERLPGILGLAAALGITRETLYQYASGKYDNRCVEKNKPRFSDVLEQARAHIVAQWEARLGSNAQCAGPIFWLKNFGGMSDRQTIEHTGTVTHRAQLPSGGEISAYLNNLKAISSGAVPEDVIDVEAEPVALPAPERGPEAG